MITRIEVENRNGNFQPTPKVNSHETETVIQRSNYADYSPVNYLLTWVKQASLRTKAIAVAVAISTLPVLGVGGFTYYLVNKSISQEISQIKTEKTSQGLPNNHSRMVATQQELLLTLTMGTLMTALLVGAIAAILANRLTLPIQAATLAVKKLAKGNLDARILVQGEDEVATLGASINRMADQIQDLLRKQKAEAERLKSFTNILIAIRQSANTADLFDTAVAEVRQALGAHRVIIYHFNNHGRGQVVAESAAPGLPVTWGETIEDSAIARELIEAYTINGAIAVSNLQEANFAPEHLKFMERLQVKASLVVPILKDNQIFGFLMAHYCWAPHVWQPFEINFLRQLAVQIGLALERVNLLEVTQALKDFAIHLSGTFSAQGIYNLAVQNIRQALKVERVEIYQFDEQWQASILAESLEKGIPPSHNTLDYGSFAQELEKYRQGGVLANQNIYQASWQSSGVKANLAAPILLGDRLLGLLVAQQCTRTRVWQESEIALFEQFARMVGLALERASLLEKNAKALSIAELASQQQHQQTQQLQQQIQHLTHYISKAQRGDLTVQVQPQEGEIAVVADFCNTIIENLREIVSLVKVAATQLNTAIADNSGSIGQLAIDGFKQTQEITRTLDTIEQMRLAMKTVAKSARLAAAIARSTTPTGEMGHTAIDLSVENIYNLRENMADTAKKAKHLGESCQQISRVTSLIHQLSLQTNLLAINAGIEASRSSDNHQGFILVSEEVATLAAKSAAATVEIDGIVANIQQEAQAVVQSLELSNSQVMEVTRLVEDSKHSLTQILDVCQQIDELVQSISLATVSQVQTSKEITNLMKDMAKVSEMTGTSARKVSASLHKTLEVYHLLQSSVGNYKIS
ncbi:GAF domain-containing protein [Calothrix sp. 336/3]|uniref:GAF domain-containing protein n=1 Tax=Calothrix sp. 336/3 TaxID=1337936 RepID=UPI0004E3F0F8|nr:GAF domain-containing protein [Calothrix sp. 336/3]AKG24267.1 hypothetical protein IJ00_25750 [Calothrix sp. 336/3]